jgi:16S rRNA G527 N7-methylase RsmG
MREPYNISLIQQYFSEFTPEQDTQLRQLGPLYEEWNAKINVISRKDIDALYEKHVLHSLAIAAIFDFSLGGQMEILDSRVFPWPLCSPMFSSRWRIP